MCVAKHSLSIVPEWLVCERTNGWRYFDSTSVAWIVVDASSRAIVATVKTIFIRGPSHALVRALQLLQLIRSMCRRTTNFKICWISCGCCESLVGVRVLVSHSVNWAHCLWHMQVHLAKVPSKLSLSCCVLCVYCGTDAVCFHSWSSSWSWSPLTQTHTNTIPEEQVN